MTDAERLYADATYWTDLAALVGWDLLGWTYRQSATFVCAGETITISGRQRDAMVEHLRPAT